MENKHLLNSFELKPEKILNNVKNFKKCSKEVKICAIIKADAYGHGIEVVSQVLKGDVDFFGVADFNEAMTVRKITNKPILILELVPDNIIGDCIENNISLSVSNVIYLKKILNKAKVLNKRAKIHLAVNSGMNRLGFSDIKKFKKSLEYVNNSDYIKLEGVYTHFYNATNDLITEVQYKKFLKFCNLIEDNNVIIHASASDAALLNNKYHFDMVRLGILMYGYSEIKPPFKLEYPLTIKSTLINIINIKKGQNVGYGNNFIANKTMKIGCVGLGYCDGFLRANSNNGKVIVMNNYANIVGNICMNLFMIDITNIKCKIGDEVIILGEKGNLKITAEDIASRTGTISYEILTNLKRNRMNYKIF